MLWCVRATVHMRHSLPCLTMGEVLKYHVLAYLPDKTIQTTTVETKLHVYTQISRTT